jgi:multiple sugar transport system permease protein
MKKSKSILKIASYIFLIVSSFIMIYPVLYMALGSFTTNDRFYETLFLPIPNTLNIAMIKAAFAAGSWDAYVSTLIRVSFYLVVNLLAAIIGGYIFSKMRFPGRDRLFLLFLSGMVMPNILMMVPMFLMMAWFPLAGGNNILGQGGHGFIYSWQVLFIYGWVPPFAIFLLKQSFDMLPIEYEDAAKMDGAGIFTIIFRVYAPLIKPPIVALIIVTFLGVWNDYLWPSLTLSGQQQWWPVAVRVPIITFSSGGTMSGMANYPAAFMRVFLATWPPVVVFFLLQRYFVQGLVASGLKG